MPSEDATHLLLLSSYFRSRNGFIEQVGVISFLFFSFSFFAEETHPLHENASIIWIYMPQWVGGTLIISKLEAHKKHFDTMHGILPHCLSCKKKERCSTWQLLFLPKQYSYIKKHSMWSIYMNTTASSSSKCFHNIDWYGPGFTQVLTCLYLP